MSRFLLHATSGHAIQLRPSDKNNQHICGAIVRLDVAREGAAILFRSSTVALLLHVDEFTRFEDFVRLYKNASSGCGEELKCKVVVWVKPAASIERLAAETQDWMHQNHIGSSPSIDIMPPYYFPTTQTKSEPLHLVKYLQETNTNPLVAKLKNSGMLEIENVSCMTNAIVMQIYTNITPTGDESVSQHVNSMLRRRCMREGVVLNKNRYLVSKKLGPSACIGLEAYEKTTPTTPMGDEHVVPHPHSRLLGAYRFLSMQDNKNKWKLPVLTEDCIIYRSFDGWVDVSIDLMLRSVRGLAHMSELLLLETWTQVHQALSTADEEKEKEVRLARALVAFLPLVKAPGSPSHFRLEVGAALLMYCKQYPKALEDHPLLRNLVDLTERSVEPHVLHSAICEVAREIPFFSDATMPILTRVYAHHVADTQHGRDSDEHMCLVAKIKKLCAGAKLLCDSNSDISGAKKQYVEARALCDATEMENSKRTKAVTKCVDTCHNHSLASFWKSKNTDPTQPDFFEKAFAGFGKS